MKTKHTSLQLKKISVTQLNQKELKAIIGGTNTTFFNPHLHEEPTQFYTM